MLTIGFSTRKLDENFKNHLISSCGVRDVEIIFIENNGEYSLTEAYNILLEKSKNDIVVLCHDDIYFDTKNWGKKLLSHFNKTDYGILGVAGTTDLSESGMWWDNSNKMVGIVNHEHEGKKWTSTYSKDLKNNIAQCCIIDGLFIALDKNKIKNNFNESVKGFHFYDLEFSFSNNIENVKVGVIFNIRITHKSIGITNDSWEENKKEFVSRWKKVLPYSVNPEVVFSPDPKITNEKYKVSVIIPTKNNSEILINCLESYIKNTKYKNVNYLIADTGSKLDEIKKIENYIKDYNNISLLRYTYFNFAKINNDVVKNHVSDDTDLLLFSNDDIELINDVITNMVFSYNKNKNKVGTLGARLYYENNTIQHSGIMLFIDSNTMILDHYGKESYYNYHRTETDVFGNTAALMMINKNLFESYGGYNEEYIECFEDVELNIRCIMSNRRNIFVPNAVAYHKESLSRSKNENRVKNENTDFTNRVEKLIIKNFEKLKTYSYTRY